MPFWAKGLQKTQLHTYNKHTGLVLLTARKETARVNPLAQDLRGPARVEALHCSLFKLGGFALLTRHLFTEQRLHEKLSGQRVLRRSIPHQLQRQASLHWTGMWYWLGHVVPGTVTRTQRRPRAFLSLRS